MNLDFSCICTLLTTSLLTYYAHNSYYGFPFSLFALNKSYACINFTRFKQRISRNYCSCQSSYGQQQRPTRWAGSPGPWTVSLAMANCQSHCIALCCHVSSTVGERAGMAAGTACQAQSWQTQGAAECGTHTILMLVRNVFC